MGIVAKEAKRDYTMSDADLAQFTGDLCNLMTRDITEFGNYSITALEVTALETLGNAFEVFPIDEVYRADVSIAVEDKNAARDALIIAIRNVSNRGMNKWGEDSPRYRKFGIININKMNDRDIVFTSRSTHLVGTEYLADLASEGLTQADLDALAAKSQDFEDALHTVKTAIVARDEKAEERVEKGNELYSYVVKYCNIGKQIWESVSEAKYNDYVLYPAEHPEPPAKVTGLVYNAATGRLTWSSVENAMEYEVAFAPDMPEPIFINIATTANLYYDYDPGGPDNYLFKVRAKGENGVFGEWSDVLIVVRS